MGNRARGLLTIKRLYEDLCALFDNRFNIVLMLMFIAYVVLWSYISLSRYFALGAYVYDLGASVESLWLALHPQGTLFGNLASFFRNGTIYLLSPLVLLPNSEVILLVLQSFFLGLPIFVIYGLAKDKLKSKSAGLALSAIYFFYFPLAGVNWYDFHFQALFIPLFLFAYYFYQKNRLTLSLLFFLLTSLTRFPYVALTMLFILVELFYLGLNRIRLGQLLEIDRKKLKVLVVVLFVGVVMFLATVVTHGGFSYFFSSSHVTGSGNTLSAYSLQDKLLTFCLIMVPVLFLPLLSKRWIIFLVPIASLIFFTDSYEFHYPFLFRLQFAAMYIPFVFLGAVDAIALLASKQDAFSRAFSFMVRRKNRILPRNRDKVTNVTLVVMLIATASTIPYLQPYGPYNSTIPGTFQFLQSTHVNMTRFNALMSILKLIPTNDPYVLVQNDMPEAYPRPVPIIMLDAGTLTTFGNITNSDIAQNSYPLYIDGRLSVVKLDYLVADVYSSLWYSVEPMMGMVTRFYQSGYYGIRAEVNGFLLLQRNYSGSLSIYSPFKAVISPNQLLATAHYTFQSGALTFENATGNLWSGPDMYILPGSYSVVYTMATSNNSKDNFFTLYAGELGNYSQMLSALTVNGSYFVKTNAWTAIQLNVTVPGALVSFELPISLSSQWSGNLLLKSISIEQTSPPPVSSPMVIT